jgi:hypothetical protein
MANRRSCNILLELLERRVLMSAAVGPAAPSGAIAPLVASSSPVFPETDLPWNIQRITNTGGRPVYSPDGSHIAYMRSLIGDCFELDLATGVSRNLTADTAYHWFTRVHYLPNGDYLLIGSRAADTVATLDRDQELWVLKRNGSMAPVPLGAKCYDGVAVSRLSNTIGWGDNDLLDPSQFAPKSSSLNVAQVAYPNGVPTLVNRRVVLRRPTTYVNGQDFRNNDSELVFVDYKGPIASVLGANLATGKITTYRSFAKEYNEAEGIFPDGKSILVESSRDKGPTHQSAQYIDIWKLPLQAGSTHFQRMTRFGDFGPFKASNPVVSPNGRFVAFQLSDIGTQAGVGDGIFLLDTQAAPATDRTFFAGNFQAPQLWQVTHTGNASVHFIAGRTTFSASGNTAVSTATLSRTINTTGLSNLSLRLQASQSGALFSSSDLIKIEVNDGKGWQRLLTDAGYFQGLDDATPESTTPTAGNKTPTWTDWIPLPVGASKQKSIQLRITCQLGTAGEQYFLNQLLLIGK